MRVLKRNNSIENFDETKLFNSINNIIRLYSDTYDTNIIMNKFKLHIPSNENIISSINIVEYLLNITSNLISTEYPFMQYVAARLMIDNIRKIVWKSILPTNSLYERIKIHCELGHYDKYILESYTKKEIDEIELRIIDYNRDYLLTYAGVRQFFDKYLQKNRITDELYELPQEANILIAMVGFSNSPAKTRLNDVKTMYDAISNLVISLPTPLYSGLRSPLKSSASCCVIDCGDDTDSILTTNYITGKVITYRYGVGINCGRIRGVGASVNNSQVIHTGVIPFLRMFESTTQGFMQNGIRGGQSTVSFPFWHYEILSIIELKNNKGVVENRVRKLDYSIGLNRFFLERALNNENITLFSSEDVPMLTNDYRYPYEQFKHIYESYETMHSVRKQTVNALDLLRKICIERYETGRIYIYFMDNMNEHSSFNESIFFSNLCQEITLPTYPSNVMNDEGLIGICILSCINVGKIEDLDEFTDLEKYCSILVRFLDYIIDYQYYPFEQLKESAVGYRPLGIGISDLFHLLAVRNLKYDTIECRNYVHKLMEAFQYYLIKTSIQLAIEKGPCTHYKDSKYSDGILPIHHYKRSVDNLVTEPLHYNWDELSKLLKLYGIRNCCLSAIPPTSSSCAISNSTPGIDPPKQLVTTKLSKKGTFHQVVSNCELSYTVQADINNVEYFKLIAVIQKFIDQSISTNSFYMGSTDVSIGDIIKEITTAYSYGMKTLYYLNSNKGTDKDIKRALSVDGITEDYNTCEGESCSV